MDVVTIRCSGGTAKVPLDVPAGMQIKNWKQGRFYEHRFLEYLKRTYKDGVWIDGGSALGNHTLFMAKFCQCERVISIDPIIDSLKLQESILQMNGVNRKVHTVHAALADYNGFGKMERFGPGVGHWQLAGGDEVVVVKLDSLNLYGVQVLKLDVEGSELAALRGASDMLLTQSPAVFCECNHKSEVKAISDYLRQFGYAKTRRGWHTMHEWRV